METRTRVWLMSPDDRPHWQAQWTDPDTGRRRTRSLKTADAREAERLRAWIEDRLAAGLPLDEERLGWAEFRERFMAGHAAGLRPSSRDKLATVLDCLEEICAPASARAVDAACLARFVAGMRTRRVRAGKVGLAPWTQRNYLAAVGKALAWGRESGLVREVPPLPPVKVPQRRPRPVDPAQAERLIAAVPGAHRLMLLLAWWAGLRLSEAFFLRWDDDGTAAWVELGSLPRIWMPAAAVKADADQWMPLHAALVAELAALERHPDGRVFAWGREGVAGPRTPDGVGSNICGWAKKAGIKLSMHRLRAGFGCRLASRVPAAVLQRLMRHASITTTMEFYALAEDSSLRSAIDAL